jgi:seryl-tRNA synthetase
MTSNPSPSLRVLAEQATSVKIRERLKQASDADRRYERPMTWDEADALLDEIEALRKALSASVGYLMNAKIDLETGATKATAIRTIVGGIRVARAALNGEKT